MLNKSKMIVFWSELNIYLQLNCQWDILILPIYVGWSESSILCKMAFLFCD